MTKRSFAQKVRGFTLIELMVVIVIIGVLATLVAPRVLGRVDEARVTKAKTDIASLMQALKMYKLDNNRYPSTEQGLLSLTSKPTTEPLPTNWKPYVEKVAVDPWGKPYQYLNPGVNGEIDVFSFGSDGQAGGTGNDADIGSWQN
jgi:general secretion pathway protein G